MKATFENSVDVLVSAYLHDELEHGDCAACAVGNLVKAQCGTFDSSSFNWYDFAIVKRRNSALYSEKNIQFAKDQIKATGYTIKQIIAIENAFERASPCGDYMFNGLMAVVDVLADIHQVDLSTKESAVLQFSEIHAMKA